MIEVRVGEHVVLRTWGDHIEQIARLQLATIRRFRRGQGFPVTFVGFEQTLDRCAAGHKTVWFHPSMAVSFDYGTDHEPIDVDENQITQAIEEMDASELGVIVTHPRASPNDRLVAVGGQSRQR
jgi:hypothetical protein